MVSALNSLHRLVGLYVCVDRPRTPLEIKAYGQGSEGLCGVIVAVGDPRELTIQYLGETETLQGREVAIDWGMSFLVTEDTRVEVIDHADAGTS